MIYSSILETIGHTPLVHLQHFSKDIGSNVYLKMESLNPGGSHKARIALGMINDAEGKGILTPGSGQTIVEPSGGNTGVGLAMAANLRGYKLILVIPDNYSPEKQKLLRLFGAEIVLSNSQLGNNSHGEKAMELQLENPEYVLLNQQRNQANPATHRTTTAVEIINDFSMSQDEKDIHYMVAGIGTGGHITGVGERLKDKWPSMRVLGVEPEACDLLNDKHAPHDIQGLSVGLIPDALNVNVLDGMVKVRTQDCLNMIRHIAKKESISLGVSSAANLVAIELLSQRDVPSGSNILTFSYDGVDSYLDYFSETQPASITAV
ncbi:cysteine synthase family protein [Parendozoicomonas sp. Alg238-R29]|uniref:PLP-dependent cysteine synthase family protein n=1 Tax=Parendozoicomonas sp. Alg238-R29 TaxID=2993446 RepID=UPI00248DD949|nr:cysteine synthase family protein [Parendozoicomonas sp. Alg238-R29]